MQAFFESFGGIGLAYLGAALAALVYTFIASEK